MMSHRFCLQVAAAVVLAAGAHAQTPVKRTGEQIDASFQAHKNEFDGAQDRWELVGADGGRGLLDFGTGKKVGAEIHIEQTFGVAAGEPSVWRIRYFDIRPDGFSWAADRSTDGGKTWVKNHQTIEARRIGKPRTLAPLAPARNAPR